MCQIYAQITDAGGINELARQLPDSSSPLDARRHHLENIYTISHNFFCGLRRTLRMLPEWAASLIGLELRTTEISFYGLNLEVIAIAEVNFVVTEDAAMFHSLMLMGASLILYIYADADCHITLPRQHIISSSSNNVDAHCCNNNGPYLLYHLGIMQELLPVVLLMAIDDDDDDDDVSMESVTMPVMSLR